MKRYLDIVELLVTMTEDGPSVFILELNPRISSSDLAPFAHTYGVCLDMLNLQIRTTGKIEEPLLEKMREAQLERKTTAQFKPKTRIVDDGSVYNLQLLLESSGDGTRYDWFESRKFLTERAPERYCYAISYCFSSTTTGGVNEEF